MVGHQGEFTILSSRAPLRGVAISLNIWIQSKIATSLRDPSKGSG